MKTSIISSTLSGNLADQLVDYLQVSNLVPAHNISVLAPNKSDEHTIGDVEAIKLVGGEHSGQISAAATGGILGLTTAIAAIAIPGLGGLLVIGPLVAILGGVASGQEAQGVVETLESFGATNAQAKLLDEQLKLGAYIIIAHTVSNVVEVLEAFSKFQLDALTVQDKTTLDLKA